MRKLNTDNTLGMIIIILLVSLIISSWVVMWGWSLFVVPIFALKPLTFLQAFGVVLLASIFKGDSYKSLIDKV